MARPQFSQTLVERRRDLGLTLEQAARVLKMKEQVLVAFEEGDWDHIPRSGYAQGMLSSYARYLGLNPRKVIDEFKQDLYSYSHKLEQQPPAPREDTKRFGYADRYMGAQPTHPSLAGDIDLYGSVGPAGSITSRGTFDDEIHHRLARERSGHRSVGYAARYVETETADQERSSGSLRSERRERRYTSSLPEHRQQQSRRSRARSRQERSSLATSEARRNSRSSVQTRRPNPDFYADDLRYDRASPYEAASTERGRQASKHIVRPRRPNVDQRASTPRSRSSSGQNRDRSAGGAASVDRRILFAIVILLFVGLMAGITLTVNSCVSNVTNAEKPQVPVATSSTTVTTSSEGDNGQNQTQEGASDQANGENQNAANAENQDQNQNQSASQSTAAVPNEVTVTVPAGEVSWVEVTMGDSSLVAQTISGPWEQTFTPTETLEIQASNAAAVNVLADGKPLSFDSKASGVGVITIEVPESDDSSQEQSQSHDSSQSQSSSSGTSGSESSSTLDTSQDYSGYDSYGDYGYEDYGYENYGYENYGYGDYYGYQDYGVM